ncbi:MAG: hydroxymethylglutaryl-CoA lyase [Flavobacteriales bacterium]
MNKALIITECPRDAMQGIQQWIPTATKVNYLNALLGCGFDYLDFGSFVSAKAIPQLQDTAEVLGQLQASETKLLAIIANARGAQEAAAFDRIDVLGYPFSISETFQKRNTNKTLEESLLLLEQVADTCVKSGKLLRVYLSMGFGNPYGDLWSADLLSQWVEKIKNNFEIHEFALSDTIGVAVAPQAKELFGQLIQEFPTQKFAAHLHVVPGKESALVEACIEAGCIHFDTAIGGYGGCPMAKDELTGNLSTEYLLRYLSEKKGTTHIDLNAFEIAKMLSQSIFN